MKTPRIAASATLLAVLAGCAGNPFAVRSLSAAQVADPARGVVLVSTGGVQRCTATALWAPIYDAATRRPAQGSPIVSIDATSDSDYPDHYGTLSTLSLPAGRYLITAQYANPGADAVDAPPTIAFDVVAGQVTYIGELWRASPCQNIVQILLRDRYDRDVALAGRLNPALAAHPPAKALGEWVDAKHAR